MAAFLEFEVLKADLDTLLKSTGNTSALKIEFDVVKTPHTIVLKNLTNNQTLPSSQIKVISPYYATGTFPGGMSNSVSLVKNGKRYEINGSPGWGLNESEKVAFSNLVDPPGGPSPFHFAIFTADMMDNILNLANLKSVFFFGFSFTLGLNERFKDAIPYKPYFSFGLIANIGSRAEVLKTQPAVNYLGVAILPNNQVTAEDYENSALLYLASVCPPGWRY